MASGIPLALKRVSLAAVLWSLVVALSMSTRSDVHGQTGEATVRILPAISGASLQDGPFDIYVVLENLEHNGSISYDDDQDGVPDRSAPSVGMAGFEFTLEFDPTVIAIEDVEQGPDLNRTGRTFQCLPPRTDEPNEFSYGCLSLGDRPAGVQGDLTLATVTVRPLARGSSPLLLSAGLAGPLGDDAVVQSVGAVVRATGSGAGSKASPTAPTLVATGATSLAPSETPGPSETIGGSSTGTASVTITPGIGATTTVSPTDSPEGPGGGGGWRPGAVFWWAVGAGGLAASGAVGGTALLLRRRQSWGA